MSTLVHVSPPSTLTATHPPWPAATIRFSEREADAESVRFPHGTLFFHELPPSLLMDISPFTAVAAAFFSSSIDTLTKCSVVPELSGSHVFPPSADRTIFP